MRELGEIKKDKDGSHKHVWLACCDCGKEFWVTWRYFRKRGNGVKCSSCRNRESALARSKGIKPDRSGYIVVKLAPNDFFYRMASKKGYCLEHRLVMARYMHRYLLPWEVVHHKNGIRDDNRLENLELLPSQTRHVPSTQWKREVNRLQKRIAELEKRTTLLEAENALLKSGSLSEELV